MIIVHLPINATEKKTKVKRDFAFKNQRNYTTLNIAEIFMYHFLCIMFKMY